MFSAGNGTPTFQHQQLRADFVKKMEQVLLKYSIAFENNIHFHAGPIYRRIVLWVVKP